MQIKKKKIINFHKCQKRSRSLMQQKVCTHLVKLSGKLSCDVKQRVSCIFYEQSIIIPNLSTDGEATEPIKTWQGWLARNIKRKQMWCSVVALFEAIRDVSEAQKRCWAKTLHFLLNTWGGDKNQMQTPDMSAPTAAASFTVHHASGLCKYKNKTLENINSS